MWHTKWHLNSPFSRYFSFPFSHSNNALYSFIYLFIYHRRYIILTISTLVACRTYKTHMHKCQERLVVIYSKSIHTYIYAYIHTCIHTYIQTLIQTYSFHQSSLCINCIWIWNMSINIRQHKTHRKIHSQDKRVKQTKTKQTNTFTGVNQSIILGHHSQWNNYTISTSSIITELRVDLLYICASFHQKCFKTPYNKFWGASSPLCVE